MGATVATAGTPAKWCSHCKSPAEEEQVRGVSGSWWRYRCTGCERVGGQHTEREHRRHLARERRVAERRAPREIPANARWYLDRDERGDG